MPRMTTCILATLLVAFPATAVAQESTPEERPTFVIHVEPRVIHAKPGSAVTFRVLAESRIDQTIELHARPGALASTTLDVAAGHANRTALKVHVPENATGRIPVMVRAIGADGQEREARAFIETKRPTTIGLGFHVKLDPHGMPGDGTMSYRLRAASRIEQEVRFEVREAPEGWHVAIEPSTLALAPGKDARAVVNVAASADNATRGRIVLVATAGDERREIVLHAGAGVGGTKPCPPPRDDAAPEHRCSSPPMHREERRWKEPREGEARPEREPMPRDEMTRLVLQLLARVARLEAALRAHGIQVEAEGSAEVSTA